MPCSSYECEASSLQAFLFEVVKSKSQQRICSEWSNDFCKSEPLERQTPETEKETASDRKQIKLRDRERYREDKRREREERS